MAAIEQEAGKKIIQCEVSEDHAYGQEHELFEECLFVIVLEAAPKHAVKDYVRDPEERVL